MDNKKFLLPLFCGLAFGLSACGGDSAADPVTPPTPDPVLSSASTEPVVTPDPATSASTPVLPAADVPLASIANPNAPVALYPAWKQFHYVTIEDESVYYADMASDFTYVFSAFPLAGRVIWSAQSSNNQCKTDVSGVMKARACTVSEGIGYGMLIACFQNDVETFNRLWNYSRGFRVNNKQNLMPWITKSFSFDVLDNSSATDADLDIAASLIIMSLKTGNQEYLADALVIAKAIWDEEIDPTTLTIMSGNTSMWNGRNGAITYNLSYFSPVAIRLFAAYDTDASHNWTGVLNNMYSYMQQMQAAGTGVFPDWSLANLTSVNPPNGAAGTEKSGFTYHSFNKESVRIPWRIAWDYYWYKDERALSVLTILNNFIVGKSGGDPSSKALAVNYSWNLAEGADVTRNTAVPTQWLAAWCATGVGTNSAWLEACTSLVNQKTLSNSTTSYFSDILLMLYSELLNGLFVRPF